MAAKAPWHRSAHTGGAAGRAELGRMVPLWLRWHSGRPSIR